MANKISRNNFVELARKELGKNTVTRKELLSICERHNINFPQWLVKANGPHYVSRGVYSLETLSSHKKIKTKKAKTSKTTPPPVLNNIEAVELSGEQLVPSVDPLFVEWGHFDRIKQIVDSKMFFPVFVTGLSGNGKTLMIEQVCATLGKKLYRVNITAETEEDDLLGGFRLVNGETVWSDGPVVRAMQEGALLLLDEVDLGDEKLMCLQPILEGKGVFLKKINRFVPPAHGFNIIATANTKGQGNEDGKFIGTNIMNEAFLERFPLTFEQPYPNKTVEKNILRNVFDLYCGEMDKEDAKEYADHLANFAIQTRKSYSNDACSEVITTRRLVHIVKAYSIFGDKQEALKHCISRFDEITQETFLETFRGLDPVVIAEQEAQRQQEQQAIEEREANKDTSIDGIFENVNC